MYEYSVDIVCDILQESKYQFFFPLVKAQKGGDDGQLLLHSHPCHQFWESGQNKRPVSREGVLIEELLKANVFDSFIEKEIKCIWNIYPLRI